MSNSRYAMFIGLNPSTADERDDDHTIRRCINYAREWGDYGALCVVNLFAYVATEPAVMKKHVTPIEVEEENDQWLVKLAKDADVIVAAWGVKGTHMNRDEKVKHLLSGKLSCLKKTKKGHPGHPLYLNKNLKPFPFA